MRGDPPGGDSSPGFEHSNSGRSPTGILPCDRITHIYMSIKVVRVSPKLWKGADDKMYYVLSSASNGDTYNAMKTVMDKEEFSIYKRHFFNDKTRILVDTTYAKTKPAAKDVILLVRCANNSMHLMLEKDVKNLNTAGLALGRWNYSEARHRAHPRTESAKQKVLNDTQHFNFLRENRKNAATVAGLKECAHKTGLCGKRLAAACKDAESGAHDHKVLNAIFDMGKRIYGNANKTWEEVCHPEAPTAHFATENGKKGVTKAARGASGQRPHSR